MLHALARSRRISVRSIDLPLDAFRRSGSGRLRSTRATALALNCPGARALWRLAAWCPVTTALTVFRPSAILVLPPPRALSRKRSALSGTVLIRRSALHGDQPLWRLAALAPCRFGAIYLHISLPFSGGMVVNFHFILFHHITLS